MDCCRPLQSVAVTICHGMRFQQLQLVALSFRHSDGGHDQTVGPDTFLPHRDIMRVDGHPRCTCTRGTGCPEKLDAMDHHIHHRRDVGGSRLRTMRLWIDEQPPAEALVSSRPVTTALSGIQFVATNGRESPAWGYCSGEHTTDIEFASPDKASERAEGLKFFVGNKSNCFPRDDMIVKAIQILIARTPEPVGGS